MNYLDLLWKETNLNSFVIAVFVHLQIKRNQRCPGPFVKCRPSSSYHWHGQSTLHRTQLQGSLWGAKLDSTSRAYDLQQVFQLCSWAQWSCQVKECYKGMSHGMVRHMSPGVSTKKLKIVIAKMHTVSTVHILLNKSPLTPWQTVSASIDHYSSSLSLYQL